MPRERCKTCSIWPRLLKPTKGLFLQSDCKTVFWGLPSNALDKMLHLYSHSVLCIRHCLLYTIKTAVLSESRHSTTTSSSCYSHALNIVFGIIMGLMKPSILMEATLWWPIFCFVRMVREIKAVFPQVVIME